MMPAIVEAIQPAAPQRNDQTLNALASLSMDYFPIEYNTPNVQFDIYPVVKQQCTNTLVLQRRQSVRQALNQNPFCTNAPLSSLDMPSSLVAGDVVRVR